MKRSKLELKLMAWFNVVMVISIALFAMRSVEASNYSIFTHPKMHEIMDVRQVYDGDSVHVTVDRSFGGVKAYANISIRIYGIDTPERRGIQSPAGKLVAMALQNYMAEVLKTQKLFMVSITDDKYSGRAVGDIFWGDVTKQQSFSEYVVKHKLGFEYWGKTKKEFTEKELRRIAKYCVEKMGVSREDFTDKEFSKLGWAADYL